MPDEPKTHIVSGDFSVGMESLATVQATMACVVEFGGLRRALGASEPEIIVRAPQWLPRAMLWFFAALILAQLIVPAIVAFKGISSGYDVQLCPEVEIKGVKISNCVRLTRSPTRKSSP